MRRTFRFIVFSTVFLSLAWICIGKPQTRPMLSPKPTDWPMWGGSLDRNMVNPNYPLDLDFQPIQNEKKNLVQRNVLWTAKLGSQSYANPVIADGRVFIGTNNASEYREDERGDRGCLLAFEQRTGKFLWQLTCEKLSSGRVNDWPEQGICSTPCVEKDRLWLVSNRAELLCLDTAGFHDGKNDGQVTDEQLHDTADADVIWRFDMIEELGVFPHNLATSSPVVYGDHVFLVTSNGVEEAHKQVVSPRSPSFIAIHKETGKLVWENRDPFDKILHGQWSSPTIGIVNGQAQVYFPGGDGWLYALDPQTGKTIWKFDLNPKSSVWRLGSRGTRNNIISTPVFVDNSVVLAVGQDPDHGNGTGHLYRIAADGKGDVSPTLAVDRGGQPIVLARGEGIDAKQGEREIINPNSKQIWHYGGVDTTGTVTGTVGDTIFHRTMSTAAVANGLVFVADLAGFVHCVDFNNGKRRAVHDTLAGIWGSTMVVDGKVLIGDEYGDLRVFSATPELKLIKTIEFHSAIYSTPVMAGGDLFVSTRFTLFKIDAGSE